MRSFLWIGCLVAFSASSAFGQDWAKEMFSETSHDFGTVARGAKVEYQFVIENKWEEDVEISSLSASCGCATPKVDRRLLKTWEKATLTTSIDTKSFTGRKDVTITVRFTKPFPAETQVNIHTYIRSDVVFQPGIAQFGEVPVGTAPERKITVNYAGRDDWKITGLESPNPFIQAKATETSRGGGLVNYDLFVSLKENAPTGYFKDQIVLLTNDLNPKSARVPLPVEGNIASALSVRPNPLFFGIVAEGTETTKQLVISGKAPFIIRSITTAERRLKFDVPPDAKKTHIVPIKFLSGTGAGQVAGKLHIETDIPDTPAVDVDFGVQVTPANR